MSSEQNPYSAPQAAEVTSRAAQVDQDSYYVDGKRLMVRDGAQLPNICIHTGADMSDGKRRKKVLYWASPWWALLILVQIIVYLIVYLCIRKKCTVYYSASPKALMKRRGIITLWLLLLIASIAGIFYGVLTEESTALLVLGVGGFVTMLVSIIAIAMYASPLRPKKHIDGWFSLAGANKEFLRKVSESQ